MCHVLRGASAVPACEIIKFISLGKAAHGGRARYFLFFFLFLIMFLSLLRATVCLSFAITCDATVRWRAVILGKPRPVDERHIDSSSS